MPRLRLFGFETLADMDLATPMAESSPSAGPELSFSCLPADPAKMQAPTDNALYLSNSLNGSGDPSVQLFEVNESTWLMRFPGIADFYLMSGEIECRLVDPRLAFMVDVLLLGHVMACYLERQGILALHAGALAVGHRAVLLAGQRGAGKSTMVTSMVAAGFSLMADDIAAVEENTGVVICRSAFPQVKLTPEQLGRFVKGKGRSYPRFHPGFPKLSVPVADLGNFDLGPRPVGAIYLLERGHEESVVIETLPPARAVAELARHSFLGHVLEATPMLRDRFAHLARLASAVPVKRLGYPDGFCHLADVHAAIENDLEAKE
ncbi:hypothetical protein [Halomonas daqiaonensis]|uniref:Hpr(Ser) kinase/phosphatase n=1 Tax=Halomonas daqiaonensis TaxID=650850 RepID=A0A1H7HHV6_9GAMM|nr:hypothetical protein [Halomonas daqiaonensis]SEK49042.1 hypothetical protein SAMN04488129_102206 [Halomonas daqiaonensis]